MKIVGKIAAVLLGTVLSTTVASAQSAKYVKANGLSFAYVEAGSGPPVVLIHGSVFDYREWSKQMKPLARHYRVIAYSRRYHWPNAQPGANADSSFEVQVADLAAIIKALNLGPVHLVGQSVGGALALHLALRYPELVRSLFLADPGVGNLMLNTPEDEVEWQKGRQARIRDIFASENAEEIVRKYAADVAPGVLEKATAEVRQMLVENVSAFRMDFTARRLPFTCEMAAKITTPALVLSGDQSPLHTIAEKTGGMLKEREVRFHSEGDSLDTARSARKIY